MGGWDEAVLSDFPPDVDTFGGIGFIVDVARVYQGRRQDLQMAEQRCKSSEYPQAKSVVRPAVDDVAMRWCHWLESDDEDPEMKVWRLTVNVRRYKEGTVPDAMV